ncbi:hypothetical protein [Arthrobacter sp. Soil762]|uniref:hypothetical protein n=1 Tax=Arthrobacter sp. Soil762 TaxID=1736401 RepID=UPI00071561A5|nr:hypothetical protein [Arthrobacter sp. Soil762]KRE71615.1 hypothetical protein ASG77_11345 [Arthrobacter sp. Soil762]
MDVEIRNRRCPPRTKARWLGANLVLAASSTVAVAVVAGTVATIGLALAGAENGPPGLLVGAALAHVPAAVVFVAATAVLLAAAPRVSIPLGLGHAGRRPAPAQLPQRLR